MEIKTSKRMNNPVLRGFRYWFVGTVRPNKILNEIKDDPNKILTAFWMNFIFAFLYSLTALISHLVGLRPSFPPWMPISEDVYYVYQAFFTIPWGLACWILLSGIAHLCALIGKNPDEFNLMKNNFDSALLMISISWVIPWFYWTFLPETFIIPWGIRFPDWFEVMRYSVFPVIWQTLLFTFGLKKTHNIKLIKSFLIAILNDGVFFVMFLAFLR